MAMVFGITEFGRAWMTLNIMHTATREGARLAVVTDPDIARVEARVQDVLNAANVPWDAITVTGPSDPDRQVTVSVTSDFVIIPGQIMKTFNGTVPLSASTTMRHESF